VTPLVLSLRQRPDQRLDLSALVPHLLAGKAAAEIERIVLDQIRLLLSTPEIIVQTSRAARKQVSDVTEDEVRSSLVSFDGLWNELFSAEQARIEAMANSKGRELDEQTAAELWEFLGRFDPIT